MSQALTEQTAIRLVTAIERLTDAMERGGVSPSPLVAERAYIANSIIGGPEAAIAENRRNRLRRSRKPREKSQ